MKAAQNYALLKGQTNQKATLIQSKQVLLAMIKQREMTIQQLAKNIQTRRTEMKGLSKEISAFIDKRMKQNHKQTPQFRNNNLSQKLKPIYAQLENVYKQGEELKKQIKQIKNSQSQGLALNIAANESKIVTLNRQITKIQNEKDILTKILETNKERIQSLQQSTCLVDLQKHEKEYQQIKEACKDFEARLVSLNAQTLQYNNYYNQIKDTLAKEILPQKIQAPFDQRYIRDAVNDLNMLADQRKTLQKESTIKIKRCQKQISQLEKGIKEKQLSIRQLINDRLRADLESKRVTSYATEPKSTPRLDKRPNPEIKVQNKSKLVNKVYMMQKQEQKHIILGKWNQEAKIYSDRGQPWQLYVQKVKKLIFLLENDLVVGVRATYIDRNGNSLEGRTMLPPDVFSYIQVEVSLQDVNSIEYSSKASHVFIRFISQNAINEIGKKQGSQPLERLVVDQYVFKWIQGQIQNNEAALRISLEDKPIEDRVPPEQSERKIRHSYSNSNLGPKKAFSKGRSLAKLKQEPLIDHRLMLGKLKIV